MKRHMYLLVLLGLFAGLLITISTSRIDSVRERQLNMDCGYSVSRVDPDQRTTLRGCVVNAYGWPAKYATSGVRMMLSDYHTPFPYDPANAGSVIAYTSFSRIRFIADWLLWSALSFAATATADN